MTIEKIIEILNGDIVKWSRDIAELENEIDEIKDEISFYREQLGK